MQTSSISNFVEYAPKALARIKDTPSQTKQHSKAERIQNLRGVFRADRIVSGRSIILVDDVVTTGATLSEAKRALRKAGAKRISCYALAH
jgi:predicted amidophosphoribosyltransferase